jgi:hypothetical protein
MFPMQYEVRIEEHVDGAPLGKVVTEACGLVWKTLSTAQLGGAGRNPGRLFLHRRLDKTCPHRI